MNFTTVFEYSFSPASDCSLLIISELTESISEIAFEQLVANNNSTHIIMHKKDLILIFTPQKYCNKKRP